MKRMMVIASGFSLLVLSGFAQAQQFPQQGGSGGMERVDSGGMQQLSVTDPAYRMTAYHLLMPRGWHFGADVLRSGGCHGAGLQLNYMMESPDRLTAVIQFAGVRWHWDNDQWKDEHHMRQCEAVEISSASDFLMNVLLPEVRPKAKIVSVVGPSEEVRQQLARAEEAERQMYDGWSREQGTPPPQHVYIDTANVRLAYEINGNPVEEMITAIIDCWGGEERFNPHPRYPTVTNLFCTSRPERVVRAPQGKLDAYLKSEELKQISQSVQPDHEWYERYSSDVRAQTARDKAASDAMIAQSWVTFNAQQAADQRFFDQLSENNRQFNQNMIMQGRQNQMIQENRMAQQQDEAHRWINFAGDKADYINSYTGQTVTLSNKYRDTFFSQDGRTAIQSNGFNPNDVPGSGVWTRSEPH